MSLAPAHRLVSLPLPARFVVILGTLLLAASSAAAQELTVRGRVVGPDGGPMALDRVVLHRVDASGGATVAEGTSGADGRFTLSAPASPDTAAVYFVAGRYEGELYIGPPFKPTGATAPEQVLQVGIAETSASAMLEEAQGAPVQRGRPATSTSWLLLIIPLLGVLAVIGYLLMPRRRVAPDRTLLMRIAEIDERIADAPQGQRETMSAERARLIEQLRPR